MVGVYVLPASRYYPGNNRGRGKNGTYKPTICGCVGAEPFAAGATALTGRGLSSNVMRLATALTVLRNALHSLSMIKSFKHKGLEEFFNSGTTRGIQFVHASKLRMQLAALNTATTIEDMNIPGYRLHPLKGDRKGTWSITVNGNWRVTFEFVDGNAYIVTYEDYH